MVSWLNNIQTKVMALFLFVALAPLVVVSAFSTRTAEELIIGMVSGHLENVAEDKAAILEKWILERKADIRVIAGTSAIKSMDPVQIEPYLKMVGMNYRVYNGFVVLDMEGRRVFDSFNERRSYSEEQWYLESRQGRLFLSDVVKDSHQAGSVFYISAPIFEDNGIIKGVVCTKVGTNTIQDVILKVYLGETGECYLVDKNGAFLAHKDPKRILKENIAQSESFKNIFSGTRSDRIYQDYRGIKVLGASRSIGGTDWFLVVEQDRDEAFRSVDRLKRYVYLAMALTAIGATIIASLLSYYFAKPIIALSNAANLLSIGKFEGIPIKSDRTDEIGVLHRAFVNMANELLAR